MVDANRSTLRLRAPGLVRLDALITVGPGGVGRHRASGNAAGRLVVAIDQILVAAKMPAKLDDFELPPPAPAGLIAPAILVGETLRQNATALPIFTIEPAR